MAGNNSTPRMDFEWDDSRFVQGVQRRIREINTSTEQDVRAAGVKFIARAKAYAAVKTGLMKNSIEMEEGRDAKGFFVIVYCRVHYWKWVEFGTRYMSAQPFMRPAYVEALAFLKARIKRKKRI